MNNENLPYTLSRWSLADLFPSAEGDEIKATFAEIDNLVAAFEKQRSLLTTEITSAAFLELVHQQEAFSRLLFRLGAYAYLWFSEDTQNQAAVNLRAQVDQFGAVIQNRTLFFSLWWKDLDEENAQRLLKGAGDYRYWLEEIRHFIPYTLTEPEEKIINIKDVTGVSAWKTFYKTLTNRYVFKLTVDGVEKELTRGELSVYVRHPDPELRKAAYQELYRVYIQDGSLLGMIYQNLVRDWHNEQVDLRKFSSPISVRNLTNDIPDEVINTLLDVSQQNTPVFQRFFRLKARWLGMERIQRYDIYAPVVKSDKTYPYSEAVGMVLEAFEQFDSHVAGLAQRVLSQNHLDSQVRKGKEDGAYCYSVNPELTPWVLVNYQGRPDDVATLAHELGHAIHAMLADNHTLFTWHAALPMAETASTFSEMMLIDNLLKTESDENVRRDLLFRQVDDAYTTIMRQIYFALFERQAHEMTHSGATIDDLQQAYLQNLKDQFGDSVEISDEFRWEWIMVPHIYDVPFYVYAYAFGQLLVLSLYQQYKTEGEPFKERYLKILSAGGSNAPAHILSEAGIDITKPEFWQGGYNVLSDLIAQLEAIPVNVLKP